MTVLKWVIWLLWKDTDANNWEFYELTLSNSPSIRSAIVNVHPNVISDVGSSPKSSKLCDVLNPMVVVWSFQSFNKYNIKFLVLNMPVDLFIFSTNLCLWTPSERSLVQLFAGAVGDRIDNERIMVIAFIIHKIMKIKWMKKCKHLENKFKSVQNSQVFRLRIWLHYTKQKEYQ